MNRETEKIARLMLGMPPESSFRYYYRKVGKWADAVAIAATTYMAIHYAIYGLVGWPVEPDWTWGFLAYWLGAKQFYKMFKLK